VPEHFYNPPENINPDPNYTPGDFQLPDTNNARGFYQTKKEELANVFSADGSNLVTLAVGEVSFSSTKNETASVLGYFRNYFGVVQADPEGHFKQMDLIVDINSLDTAVPGRNNRILALLFESQDPEKGVATLQFDRLEEFPTFREVHEGDPYEVKASGRMILRGVTKTLSASLQIEKRGSLWAVETREPIVVFLSDFGFENQVYAMMKSCNHQSLGNAVKVNVKLYFK
jgi:polyisoprenoid-binding protein YceI